MSIDKISEEVGMSRTPCWNRIKRMESEGIIKARVVLIDHEKAGLGATAFIAVHTSCHGTSWTDKFAREVTRIPEVLEFYRMAGDIDYLIKVCLSGLEDYDRVYKKIVAIADLHNVSAYFAMEEIKSTTYLPLEIL
jgi:Lrp/AsnC family transcriptional regulator